MLDIVLSVALAAAAAMPSFATERHQFDVSAEDAQAAIQNFAAQAQVQILVAGEQIRDKRLNSVSGDFSTDDALQRLLIGTGLTPQYVSDRAIALVVTPAVGMNGEAGFEDPSPALRADRNDTLDRVSPANGRTKLKNSNFISRFMTFLGSALAGTATFAVHAQNAAETRSIALEEIVVTAERRESNVQKTAASISVRSGANLMEQGKFSLGQILEDIPGISGDATYGINGSTTDNSGSDNAASNLIIRGIPSNGGAAGTTVSAASSAAIYVDGVYEGVGRGYDIDRVEVLRGPQGTLYGRSATSGVVAVHTRNPELKKFGGNASVELGSYDLRHYTAALNLPAGDALALRVSANRYERDGYYGQYISASEARGGKGGSIETTDARLKLLYSPNSDLTVLFGFAMQDNTNYSGGAAIARSSNRDVFVWQAAPLAKSDNSYRQYWAEVNWNLGFGTLTYQPAFRTWTQAGHTISSAAGTGRLVDLAVNTPKDDFWTHELRLSSNPNSSLIWQAGVLYYDNDLTNSRVYSYQDNGRAYNSADTQKSTETLGVFAQATYPFTDASRLTAGARYDHTEVATSQSFFYDAGASANGPANITRDLLSKEAGTRRFDNWTYTLRGEHDLSVSNLIYGSISTGFSPGEVSLAVCMTGTVRYICPIVLQAETLTAYEIGSKNRFLDERLQLNGAAFYYDYGAFQTGLVNVTSVTNPNDPPTFATLSAPVKAYGAEFEMLYQITAADRLGINVGYTHAYYVDKPAQFAGVIARDTLGDSPLTANLSYDHIFNLPGGSKLTLHGDVRYLSAHDGALNVIQKANGGESYVRIGAETLGNASTTWTAASGVLSLTAWVRNVADKVYPQTVTLSGNTQPFGFTQILNEPRTYGASVNVSF